MRFIKIATSLVLFVFISATERVDAYNKTPFNYIHIPPPIIDLTQKDRKHLRQGQRLLKTYQFKGEEKQLVVFRVRASQEQIWQTITNYQNYPEWVKGVKQTDVYKQDDENIYVDFEIGHWLLGKFRYSVRHFISEFSWIKWQLDESRYSDFALSEGYWRVVEANDETNSCDVFYSADVRFKKAKSESMRNRVIRAGLKQTSVWVTREAEKLSAN